MAKRIKAGDPTVGIGYVRVSTDEQTLSPEAQRAAIERWAQTRGVRLVEMFEDVGLSGGLPAEKRPGLLGAQAALRVQGAGLLIAAKRDRVARDVVVAAAVEQAAARAGARLATADGTSDGTGPEGRLMSQIVDVFSEYERAIIRSRTKTALAVKKSRGERVGVIPFGFQLAPDGVHLEPNPAEQSIVERIRVLRAAGKTLQRIADECAQAGIVSRSGKPLGLTQVARIAA